MTQKPRLLIYCEGETEKIYLQTLIENLKLSQMPCVRKTSACDPLSLLSAAYKDYAWSQATEEKPFTEIWIVFDRDHHGTYNEVFEVVKKLPPVVHLCWTNPCIEFWFWLHYCGDRAQLTFDDAMEISKETKTVDLGDGLTEETVVRRVQRSIRPETMLSLLRTKRSDYVKAAFPAGILRHTRRACANLDKAAQSADPAKLGSAMPALLHRLEELCDPAMRSVLGDEAGQPEKAVEATPEPAPASLVAAIEPVVTPTDGDPMLEHCRVLLRDCLADWANIEVYPQKYVFPDGALARLETLFNEAKQCKTDAATRLRADNALCILKNMRSSMQLVATVKRIKNMLGRLTALGSALSYFGKRFEMEAELVGIVFQKKLNYGEPPAPAQKVRETQAVKAVAPSPVAEPAEPAADPLDEAVMEPDVEKAKSAEGYVAHIPAEDETTVLSALQETCGVCAEDFDPEPDFPCKEDVRQMQDCSEAFERCMEALSVPLSDELRRSQWEKAVALQMEATRLVESLTARVEAL